MISMARCDPSQDDSQNTRTDGFAMGNRKPVFNLIVFEAHLGKRFKATPSEGGEGGARERAAGSEWNPTLKASHTSVFSCSTSGPPIWPGSTFFKRNGALLQGRCLGAPPPVPSSPSLLLCAWPARSAPFWLAVAALWRGVTVVPWV